MNDANVLTHTPSSSDPLLSIYGLCVEFPSRIGPGVVHALSGVDLVVNRSEIVGLVGGSGCGKTVLCLSILRLIDPPGRIAGRILWRNRDLLRLPEHDIRRVRGREIAMIFQNAQAALNPVRTIGRHLHALLRLHRDLDGPAADAEARRVIDSVRLPDATRVLRAYPHELSAGMAQRVMIAMAIVCQAQLILADEPTASLDSHLRDEIGELLADVCRTLGTSILLVSHDLDLVQRICGRVYSMAHGRIVRPDAVRPPTEGALFKGQADP